jgi:hypothetical protein
MLYVVMLVPPEALYTLTPNFSRIRTSFSIKIENKLHPMQGFTNLPGIIPGIKELGIQVALIVDDLLLIL